MSNKEIAQHFQELAQLMELHKDNPFKIKAYQNNYIHFRKLDKPLAEMGREGISALKGVGKATTDKILELVETGQMQTLEKWRAQTPPGVVEMLGIRGFGPSKVRVVWKDLGAESVGELLYACHENRLVTLKGFGQKTQQDLIQKIHFHQQSQNRFLYAHIAGKAQALLEHIQEQLPGTSVAFSGAMRRKCPIIDQVDILVGQLDISALFGQSLLYLDGSTHRHQAQTPEGLPVVLHTCEASEWGSKQFRHSAPKAFLQAFLQAAQADDFRGLAEEEAVFRKAGLPYLVPELREDGQFLGKNMDELVTEEDLRGIVHAHSTYSDGTHSLREMAEYAQAQGYHYLVMTDHSQSAFYANGMKEERVRAQWAEIEELNTELQGFTLYKGIESDILNDGRLDYPDDLLEGFDYVIASVHSHLQMDESKATQRIIRAIEHPATDILGHPSGRLLLSRQGYPLDYPKIIDACAANGVAIELNANPMRLDLDYRWIPLCMEKGVKISINPDAHSTAGIHDISYGVMAARKGGLRREFLWGI